MPFDLLLARNAVYQTLLENNTTTSANYLSTDMSATVQVLSRAKPEARPLGGDQLPALWIFPESYADDYADLGNVPRRSIVARIGVVGAVRGSPTEGSEHAENNLNHLMRNITRIFRVDHRLNSQTTFDLSNTVTGLNQEVDMDYRMPEGGDPSYAASAIAHLTIRFLST